jgi:hypothetical protein
MNVNAPERLDLSEKERGLIDAMVRRSPKPSQPR